MVEMLNDVEVRVLGCLLEKQRTTPEYYPLTLNALTNACNQLSNRDPVVSFEEKQVVRALDALREKKLAWTVSAAGSRVPKYEQRLTEALELKEPETAALCLLMLRGPQTAGEIRSRAGRLYAFSDVVEVESALQALVDRPHSLITSLPRQPGTRETRYAHLLSGEVQWNIASAAAGPEPARLAAQQEDQRIGQLEQQIEKLSRELNELKRELQEFRRQFD
jgi:uncharacterized protein